MNSTNSIRPPSYKLDNNRDISPATPMLPLRATVLVFIFLIFIYYLLRCIITAAPIMGSDEYVYYILSRHMNQDILFALDPGLQRIDNRLYFFLQHLWLSIGDDTDIIVTRTIHLLEWSFSSIILYSAFSKIAENRSRLLAVSTVFFLPSSFYILTMMPETDLIFMSSLLGYVVIRWLYKKPLYASLITGLICGISILLKPHAISWAPAILSTIGCVAYIRRKQQKYYYTFIISTAIFIIGWYLGFILGWRLSSGGWSMNPATALGLQFYGSYISKAGDAGFFSRNIISFLVYFAAHFVALSLFFGPALIELAIACRNIFAKSNDSSDRMAVAGFFVVTMTISILVMICYFTASAGEKNAEQSLRLHGRYLGVILIYLPFFYFIFLEKLQTNIVRIYSFAGLCITGIFYIFIFKNFKIFPWDYPELFSFFSMPNHYGWGFSKNNIWGEIALIWHVTCFITLLARPKWFRATLTFQLIGLLGIGHIQMQFWLRAHMETNSNTIKTAEAINKSLPSLPPGDGLVIGSERYGEMSYLLFGLGNAPRVLIKEPGTTINASDILGAHWVITSKQYNVEFPFRSSISYDNFTFYPLATTRPSVKVSEKKSWPGNNFVINFGIKGGAESQLLGFNPSENWGSWTAKSIAEVELPYYVQGKIHLKLFGWILPDNIGNPVRITLGDSSFEVQMTASGNDYQIDFCVNKPSDRIKFEIPIVRASDSSRDMGVAIRDLEISRK